MSAVIVSLARVRVQRNCRLILEANRQTMGQVNELRATHASLTASLDSVREGLQGFSDSLDTTLERLRESGRRQRRIMDRIEKIQASSDVFS